MSYLLGVDIGTTGTRALICSAQGDVIASAVAPHDLSTPHPGWSEQAPTQWWTATGEATRAALTRAEVAGDDVAAIGLSGQMHGAVFLDGSGSGQPLRPAILWNDQRTVEQCEEIRRRAGGRERLIAMVGNPALTGFTAPKILWVREHEPRIYQRTRHVLLPKDYIRFRMTGEYAADVGDASGTLLLDVRNRRWNGDLMSLLDLEPAMMPPCFESHAVTGQITREAAAHLGVAAGIPVVAGSGDQPAGAVGNGIVRAGIVSATLGTSGVVFAHSDKPTYDPRGRVHTMCAAVEGRWCVFGCMLSAGGAFQWLRDTLGGSASESRAYDNLIEEAQSAPPGSDGLLFLPYLTGERCPHPDPDARGGWIGLTARHTRAHLIRSVLEGVTFGMADALDIIRGMDVGVGSVRLSGGGARSPFWCQLQADVYNCPASLTTSEQGPAFGAALLAGVGIGVWNDVADACRSAIRETRHFTPDPHLTDFYAAHHAQYQRLYHALHDEFPRFSALPIQ